MLLPIITSGTFTAPKMRSRTRSGVLGSMVTHLQSGSKLSTVGTPYFL